MTKEDQVALGIASSQAETQTWQGFESATEHSAPQSETEQAALSIQPGAPTDQPETPPAPQPAPAPVEQAEAPPQEQAQPEPAQLLPVQLQSPQPALTLAEVAATTSLVQLAPPQTLAQQTEPFQPKPARPEALPQDASPSPPTPPTPPTPPEPRTTESMALPPVPASAIPGEKSDQESIAAAIKSAIDYRPGRPVAREGLQVRTVLPRWSATTRVVSHPDNAIVRIEFDRTGRVITATFLELNGKTGTGYKDVDGPLLDSVYRWTAKGKDLEALPTDEPQATVNVVVRFLMRS